MALIAPLLLSLLLLVGYVTAASLLVYALLPGQVGWRWWRVTLVPAAVGAVLLVILLTALRGPSRDLLVELGRGSLPAGQFQVAGWTARGMVAMTVVAALLGVYLAAHALPNAAARWRAWRRRARRWVIVDVVRAGLLAGLLVVLAGTTVSVSALVARGHQISTSSRVLATHQLPGTPTGIAVDGDSGYFTFGEGQIARFSLSAGDQDLAVEVLADGLNSPRGPLVVDGELLVVDLGPAPCPEPFPQCMTVEPAEELRRINASSGRVLGYPIAEDGSLGPPRELFTGLPVVNTYHAPSSLSLGPDGAVYLPIGGFDYLFLEPELLDDVDHPRADLLGTLVRFRPGDADVEVVATGLRNIYAVTFDPEGHVLGVDNDGPTGRGWHHEQLVEIVDGQDYGYPAVGSFDEGVPPPLWTLNATGSAGISWFESAARPGVLTGSSGQVQFVPVEGDGDGLYVPTRHEVRAVITGLTGFVTAVAPLGGDRYAVTTFDPSGLGNAMLILEVTAPGG